MTVTHKAVVKESLEVEDILCDCCGNSCIGDIGNFCGVRIVCTGGYDSPVFIEDTTGTYEVCENCLAEWMMMWKNRDKVSDILGLVEFGEQSDD